MIGDFFTLLGQGFAVILVGLVAAALVWVVGEWIARL